MRRWLPHRLSNGSAKGGGGAFTLLELMVSVAVTSLLVSMTVPVCQSAVRQARVVMCRSQLANLTAHLTAYATDSSGWYPPGPIERSAWPGDPDRGSPYELYDRARVGNVALSSQSGWYGLGLLWKSRYVEQGRMFFCPSAGGSGGVSFEQAWPRSFDSAWDPADGKTRIYSTYAFRGGLTSQFGKAVGPMNALRLAGPAAILADNPCSGQMWHAGGYNVAFTDGRVEFFASNAPVVLAGELPVFWQAIQAH